jgi:hypothetical protein
MGKIRNVTNKKTVKRVTPPKQIKRIRTPIFVPLVSNCCGAGAYGDSVNIGICTECKEHCEYLEDSEPIEPINEDRFKLDTGQYDYFLPL